MNDHEANTRQRGDGYEISTDSTRIDRDLTHRFLSEEAYWSPGVARATVEKAIDNSLVFGVYKGEDQVGFARIVTDYTTFAWLCDVFILPDHRGQSLGKWLMECITAHPQLQGLRRMMLATRDAHGLYAQFGWEPVPEGRFMQRSPETR